LLGLSEAIKAEGSQPKRANFLHVIKPAMSFGGFIYFGNEDFSFISCGTIRLSGND
jgi:hypothetical protein